MIHRLPTEAQERAFTTCIELSNTVGWFSPRLLRVKNATIRRPEFVCRRLALLGYLESRAIAGGDRVEYRVTP